MDEIWQESDFSMKTLFSIQVWKMYQTKNYLIRWYNVKKMLRT